MRFILLLLLFASVSFGKEPSIAYLPVRALPTTLDPPRLTIATDSYIFRQIAEGLFAIGDAFQIDPRMAEKIEWKDNQKTLLIHLKPENFSNGVPVTAQDVADSLSYCIQGSKKTLLVAVDAVEGYEAFVQGHSKTLSGLRAIDPSTVEVRLKRQAPLLLDDLAQADCEIVKPAPTGSRDLLKGAIGSGPYQLGTVTTTELQLIRNTHYTGPTRGPDTAIFRLTEDFGNFDHLKSWATMATTEAVVGIHKDADPSYQAIESSELGTYQLIFNNSKPPFNQKDVRKAVALAIDYETLEKSLGWSSDTLQAGMVPLGMTGFKRRMTENRAHDLALATKLLKQAGYTKERPLHFTILLSKLPDYEREESLWPKLFSGVAIDVRTEVIPHAERNARQDRGEFQAIRAIKYAGSIESHRLLASYLTGSIYNPTKSRVTECDRITRQAIATTDRDSRFNLYDKADECLINNAVLVPLASIQPGYVFLKKPWKLARTNRYLLYPYWISEWSEDESN